MYDNDNVRMIGYCAECGANITDDADYYCDEEGYLFCSCECAMEHYGIHKLEV